MYERVLEKICFLMGMCHVNKSYYFLFLATNTFTVVVAPLNRLVAVPWVQFSEVWLVAYGLAI